ncbi:hypothetical protein GCM10025864_31440 [Luteimicrobium album]|uniref:Uncharacterized protein n=1 Tax=Luteimicrobium album TaxID=1054550 RepID=A0ABQ6I4F5_9MICO|nr:hypothetical protein GCM10025864_31440 [Luteimicrobium album]
MNASVTHVMYVRADRGTAVARLLEAGAAADPAPPATASDIRTSCESPRFRTGAARPSQADASAVAAGRRAEPASPLGSGG